MKNSFIFTPPVSALLVLLASAGGLLAVYIAQYGFGLVPCELCLWQRLPYYASAAVAMVVLLGGRQVGIAPVGFVLLVLVWLTSMGLAVYHSGVEQHWWVHGGACGGGAGGALTPENLREQLLQTPVKRCDEVDWTLFGLSMANFNVFFSAAMAVFNGMVYAKNYAKK